MSSLIKNLWIHLKYEPTTYHLQWSSIDEAFMESETFNLYPCPWYWLNSIVQFELSRLWKSSLVSPFNRKIGHVSSACFRRIVGDFRNFYIGLSLDISLLHSNEVSYKLQFEAVSSLFTVTNWKDIILMQFNWYT